MPAGASDSSSLLSTVLEFGRRIRVSSTTSTAVAILAGGLGTRLRAAVPDRPKVLAAVGGRPFLAYLLDQVGGAGFQEVVLCTGYRSDQIEAAFGDSYSGLRLVYSREAEPRGTGGALRLALPLLEGNPILVMNGDSYCAVDLARFQESHVQRNAVVSMVLTDVSDASRFGAVAVDSAGRVIRFAEKAAAPAPGLINAGIYLFDRKVVAGLAAGVEISLEREVLPGLAGTGLYGFRSEGSFTDIGTSESYASAAESLPANKSEPTLKGDR